MIPIAAAAVAIEYSTGEIRPRRAAQLQVAAAIAAPAVSDEGMAIAAKARDVIRMLEEQHQVSVASVSAEPVLSLAAPMPDTWLGIAQAVFPNSRRMTRAERRAFEASNWKDLGERIEFTDE